MSSNNDNGKLLEGKVAIVTGGGRGIGRATALALAEAGADVAVAARTHREIEETAEAVTGLGQRGLAVVADISKPEDVHDGARIG